MLKVMGRRRNARGWYFFSRMISLILELKVSQYATQPCMYRILGRSWKVLKRR
jgi:hypothetical protein